MAQAQAYNVLARIHNPQPNEGQGAIPWFHFVYTQVSYNSLLISDAANPNGRSPIVGDCFTSHTFASDCMLM